MQKFVASLTFLGILLASGACASATGSPGYPVQGATSSLIATQPVVSSPILDFWVIGDRPVVSGDGITFATHLVYFDGTNVTVIYSLSGPNAVKPLDGKLVHVTDEGRELVYPCYPPRPPVTEPLPADLPPTQTARPYPPSLQTQLAYPAPTLIPQPTLTLPPYPVATQPPPTPCTPTPFGSTVTPLAQLGQLQIGAVTSGPRISTGGREIHVLLDLAPGAQPLDVFVAKVIGQGQLTPSSGTVNREDYLDQSGYRISFNGYWFGKGDQVAEMALANMATGVSVTEKPASQVKTEVAAAASWTPAPPRPTSALVPPTTDPLALELAGGQPIRMQATLRIEDLATKVPQYLFIVFLMDGSVKATLVQ